MNASQRPHQTNYSRQPENWSRDRLASSSRSAPSQLLSPQRRRRTLSRLCSPRSLIRSSLSSWQVFGGPGGNMTGVTFDAASETPAKRLQLLKEVVPNLSRVTVLHPHGDPLVGPQLETIKEAAPSLSIRLNIVSFQGPDDLESTFSHIRTQGGQGLLVIGGTMVWANRQKIVDLALAHRLPSSLWSREMVAGGGLISLGPNYPDMLRQTATFVDKILKGAKPADLPVEQPTQFELWINLKTAKALGLTIPPSLLQRADQVIE